MKKRILSVLLVAVLSLSVITGCGSDETTNDAAKVNTQEASAEPTQAPTEAPTAEPTGAPTPEPTEAPTPEPTEAPTPEPTEAPTEAPVEETSAPAVEVVDGDWSAAYEGYFEREGIMPEKMQMTMDVSQDGLTFGFEVATADGNTYINFDFGVVALDMYADAEKIYTHTIMEGEEVWNFAPITSEEDVEGVMSMGDTAGVDTSAFTSCEYFEEVTEDGVVYDVLYTTSEEDGEVVETYCYVNRETQMISKMVVESEAGPMPVYITEIDSVEIPAEALNGTEVTMDDVMGTVFGVIMMGAFSAMEQ
ncbi:MAG: PT domain-containing protein [Lachnospiraceae bacterium]|nr:PT domain-containing protein [Lachnospiraceae bacterium]